MAAAGLRPIAFVSLSTFLAIVFAHTVSARVVLNTIDANAVVTDNGRHVIVTGPIVCDSGERAEIHRLLRQIAVDVTERSDLVHDVDAVSDNAERHAGLEQDEAGADLLDEGAGGIGEAEHRLPEEADPRVAEDVREPGRVALGRDVAGAGETSDGQVWVRGVGAMIREQVGRTGGSSRRPALCTSISRCSSRVWHFGRR